MTLDPPETAAPRDANGLDPLPNGDLPDEPQTTDATPHGAGTSA